MKKIISLLLMLVLVFSLASCGGENDDPGSSGGENGDGQGSSGGENGDDQGSSGDENGDDQGSSGGENGDDQGSSGDENGDGQGSSSGENGDDQGSSGGENGDDQGSSGGENGDGQGSADGEGEEDQGSSGGESGDDQGSPDDESEDGLLSIVSSSKPTKISTITAYVVSETETYRGNNTMLIEGNDSIFEFSYERRATIEEMAPSMKVTETGVVYYKDGLYSYGGDEWNSESPSAVKIDFNLNRDYFDSYTESGNSFVATVSGANVAKVLGSNIRVDGVVTIEVYTNGVNLTRIDVDYKTSSGASVSVATSYTYDTIDLTFPGEPADDNGGAHAE